MLTVDEFESVFRSADKRPFTLAKPTVSRILVVTDLEEEPLARYDAAARKLLEPLLTEAAEDRTWMARGAGSFTGVEGVLRLVEETQPDLVVTYRNLNSDAWRWSYSLGVYLNALTRGTTLPVLVTPSPHASPDLRWQDNRTDSVMVVTDHLTGDDPLVNWGVVLARSGGKLWLTHVEHDESFARFVDAISKVPEVDTETARKEIWEQLLKEPRDYIASAVKVLQEAGEAVDVHPVVTTGHRVADYRRLVADHEVDVLVFPTLEEDRIALGGVAYSLAVELVDTPLLMV